MTRSTFRTWFRVRTPIVTRVARNGKFYNDTEKQKTKFIQNMLWRVFALHCVCRFLNLNSLIAEVEYNHITWYNIILVTWSKLLITWNISVMRQEWVYPPGTLVCSILYHLGIPTWPSRLQQTVPPGPTWVYPLGTVVCVPSNKNAIIYLLLNYTSVCLY